MTGQSEELWQGVTELAERCLQHPFVRGLADGTLPPDRYAKFIAQDAFFLDVFARAYAAGVFRAPEHDERLIWHELQSGVFEELELHAAASKELGIDLAAITPLQATRAYTDFLLANAFGGTLGELLAAMAPCMRLYYFLGLQLANEDRPTHRYTSWIETYASPEFAQLVEQIEGLMDRYGQGTDGERDRYEQAMRLEYGFFSESWRE